MNSVKVRRMLIGFAIEVSQQSLNSNGLKWLGHVSRISTDRLYGWTLFSKTGIDQEIGRRGQSTTCHRGKKSLTWFSGSIGSD